MCSISWIFRSGGYELVFNRDEKWTRTLSLDPSFETHHFVPGFCARDGQAKGTWLFTNQAGITLALLNAYPGNRLITTGQQSRGEIPLLAGKAETSEALVELLQNTHYTDYAPFDLIMLDGVRVRRFSWDSKLLCETAVRNVPFVTSSSVASDHVTNARMKRFEEISKLPLIEALSDTKAANPEEAIYVNREDGGTVSQTYVQVNWDTIHFAVARRGEEPIIQSVPRTSLAVLD